jgi:hypothetical protein
MHHQTVALACRSRQLPANGSHSLYLERRIAMSNKLLLLASVLSVLSMSAAQAQETTNGANPTVSQNGSTATMPPDSTGYGGATNQSATGSAAKDANGKQTDCAPRTFCDIYKGQ